MQFQIMPFSRLFEKQRELGLSETGQSKPKLHYMLAHNISIHLGHFTINTGNSKTISLSFVITTYARKFG